jgi:ABC-2 type transport system ATP-binding protein
MTCPPASADPSVQPALAVRGLAKRYGPVQAVRGIDFDVAGGEIVGLLGPNGAGKTTTLECVLGLIEPDAGTIAVQGSSDPSAYRARIGAQLQSTALQDKITPREALGLFAAFYPTGVPSAQLIDRFGLAEKADARFDTLSGGQRQRLGLALAFVNDPQLIVLDEPTAGLDPASRRALHELIRASRREGRAVLLSTHYIDEAATLCDRIAIVDHGQVVATGTPGELVKRAGISPRIQFRTARQTDLISLSLGERAGIISAEVVVSAGPSTGEIRTTDVAGSLTALLDQLKQEKNALLELHVSEPSLEDAFVQLTGAPIPA